MITELNELSDIGDEFGKTLSQAGKHEIFLYQQKSQLSGTARYSRKSNGLNRL